MNNKKAFSIVGIIVIFIIAICVILLLQTKDSTIDVNISSSGDINGGTTKYEVTGTKSEIDANKAIIKKVYNGDNSFRAITDQELQNIADEILANGCGQITESYILGPPISGAVNWTNFGNNNHDNIVIYMLDNQYLVHAECSKR